MASAIDELFVAIDKYKCATGREPYRLNLDERFIRDIARQILLDMRYLPEKEHRTMMKLANGEMPIIDNVNFFVGIPMTVKKHGQPDFFNLVARGWKLEDLEANGYVLVEDIPTE